MPRAVIASASASAMVLALASGLACALGACAAPASPTAATTRVPAWQVRATGGQAPIAVGTDDPALLDAGACAGCHAAIVDEWRTSRHALAWTNGIFQREYRAQPRPWCVNCHAPTPPQQASLSTDHALADQGVDCATCHVRGGRLVAARRAPASPHDTIVDASFGSPAYCADCHDFTFPRLSAHGVATSMTDHPMQSTVTTFRAGPYARAADGCMTCHDSEQHHAFPGAHADDTVDTALDLAWCRRGGSIVVSLANLAAGHPVPTGDVHRHLILRLWRSSAPEALFDAFFGRRFEPAPDGGKLTTFDSSLAPGEIRPFTIDARALSGDDPDADPAEPLNLELRYVFTSDEEPHRGRAPSEPTYFVLDRRRLPLSALPSCE